MSSRSRNWCFTWNQPSERYSEDLSACMSSDVRIKYLCGQLESGASSHSHFQGYVELKESVSMSTVRSLLPSGSHVEPRKGTRDQARDYTRKEESRIGEFIEFGTFGIQGKRKDLDEIWQLIKSGENFVAIADAFPADSIRYGKHIKQLCFDVLPDRTHKTEILWFFGETGSGKSKAAFDRFPGSYWKPNNRWWDQYDPRFHDTVIWDDWDPLTISYKEMLRLCDRYPLTVEYKGGSLKFIAKRIIFTSLRQPADMDYPWNSREFLRRVDHVERFIGEPDIPDVAASAFGWTI